MDTRTEHSEQSAFFDWVRMQSSLHPVMNWIHAIPNGASLSSKKEAIKLKEEGLTPGICDVFIPWASRGFHGFYIEFKRPGKLDQVRPGQKNFMAFCETAGILAQVYDNADDAVDALKWYLGI